MIILTPGKAVTIDQIVPGWCFVFRRDDVSYVAIGVTPGPKFPRCAVLWPNHPTFQPIRGLVDVEESKFFEEQTLLLLTAAVAAPKTNASDVRSQTETRHEIGSLAVAGDASLNVTILYNENERAWVDLKSGKLEFDAPKPAMWFPRWEILIPDADGVHRPFCEISASPG